jgi:DNA polymerase-3 subunit gamma/tau
MADAIAREDAPALFEMAGRAVESGYDLRLVVRELARMTRDLLVLTIDPSRISDPEIAADAERQALLDLSRRFSGEDLMRAFDVLTKAEFEIRSSMQPRYHLEMALLRWLHLRKLVPLTDLIEQMKSGGPRPGVPRELPTVPAAPSKAATVQAVEAKRAAPAAIGERAPTERAASEPAPAEPALTAGGPHLKAVAAAEVKDAVLGEIRKAKKFFYGTVVAQAQRIDVEADKVVFVFGPQHRALRVQLEQNRPWLEAAASQLAGRRLTVTAAEGTATPAVPPRPGMTKSDPAAVPAPDRQQALRERALSDTGVQTMLDVFAADIKDVEEM